MRRIKTRGVVIKRLNFNEADKILTIFTDRLGKIKAIAKGVRKISSRMAGSLEPYNLLELEMHQGKTFYIVTGARIIENHSFDRDRKLSMQAVYVAEIIDKIFEEEEKNIDAFELFIKTLKIISEDKNRLILLSYELKILDQAGFKPDFYHCFKCKKKLKPDDNYLSENDGLILCSLCAQGVFSKSLISNSFIKLLRLLQNDELNVCQKIKCPSDHVKLAKTITEKYLENALERELVSKKQLIS